MNLSARFLPLLSLVSSLALGGCIFLDEEPNTYAGIRGYTDCGDFLGDEVLCAPGQFCLDWSFSECEIGCLSDVNCASNQYCHLDPREDIGTCLNADYPESHP